MRIIGILLFPFAFAFKLIIVIAAGIIILFPLDMLHMMMNVNICDNIRIQTTGFIDNLIKS